MKNENVPINEKYMVGGVNTEAGKNRMIPIADKIFLFVQRLYDKNSIFLLHSGNRWYQRADFLNLLWYPAMQSLHLNHLPHDTRYTCASMMDRAGVNENCKKTILGHAKSDVTNKIYVGKNLKDLLDAINII